MDFGTGLDISVYDHGYCHYRTLTRLILDVLCGAMLEIQPLLNPSLAPYLFRVFFVSFLSCLFCILCPFFLFVYSFISSLFS